MIHTLLDRRWLGLQAFAVVALVTIYVFLHALAAEREGTRLRFEQASVARISVLRRELDTAYDLLGTLGAHLEMVDSVSVEGFRRITLPLLSDHPYLQAVGYTPRVRLADRARFEAEMDWEIQGFQITEADEPGHFVVAGARPEYFPFLRVEPLAANRMAIGFDAATDPGAREKVGATARAAAMAVAVARRGAATSAPVRLALPSRAGVTGVLAFFPLFRDSTTRQLSGFVTLVVRIGDLVNWVAPPGAEGGTPVQLSLVDVSGPTPLSLHEREGDEPPVLRYDEKLELPGGRVWRVTATPLPDSVSLAPGMAPLFTLFAGLGLSVLLGVLIHTLVRTARTIERRVEEKTAELAVSNRQLYEEVAQRRFSAHQLMEATTLQRAILDDANYAIIATDADGLIRVFNPAAERILGYRAEEVLGKLRPTLFHDPDELAQLFGVAEGADDRSAFLAIVAKAVPRGEEGLEVVYITKAGGRLPVRLSVSGMKDESGCVSGFVGIANDITEHKQAQAHIAHLAHFDALTDLPNRGLLQTELRSAIAVAERAGLRLGVLFIDLDRFKNINDSLGHHVGDELLQRVARLLSHSLRDGDIVARMGGDEFVVLLKRLDDSSEAAEVANRLLGELRKELRIGEHRLSVTPSIGIALFPDDGRDADVLIRNADTAMYSAKAEGRNCYNYFDASMNLRVSERLGVENALRQALARGGLVLHYQPQFAAADGRLVGVEALVRMQGTDGLVSPAVFVPVAEECGLILALGDWVLREAASRLKAWIDSGLPPIVMAVNVSARQFDQRDFPARVDEILAETGLDPRWLELELTESTVMQEARTAVDALHALKLLGLRIAIDDFGTGFSSLSYLGRFPIDSLKIDRSFVASIGDDEAGSVTPRAILNLAHQLQLKVVAEGVETAAQKALLCEWGCDVLQGYLLGRPMDEAALLGLLARPSPAGAPAANGASTR